MTGNERLRSTLPLIYCDIEYSRNDSDIAKRTVLNLVGSYFEDDEDSESLYLRYPNISTLSISSSVSVGGPWALLFGFYTLIGDSWTKHIDDAMHQFMVYGAARVTLSIGRSAFNLYDRVPMTLSVGAELKEQSIFIAMQQFKGSSTTYFIAECGFNRAGYFNAFGWHYAVNGGGGGVNNIEGGFSYNVSVHWAPTGTVPAILDDAASTNSFEVELFAPRSVSI